MLNNNKDFKFIKWFCKKNFGYSSAARRGCHVEGTNRPLNLLIELGHNSYSVGEGTHFSTFGELTGYNKALFLCMNIDDLSAGHAVAWDGCKIYDPDSPRIMSEKEFRKHYPYVNAYDVTIIKIGFHRRVANMFKTIWYDSRDWFNDRHQL